MGFEPETIDDDAADFGEHEPVELPAALSVAPHAQQAIYKIMAYFAGNPLKKTQTNVIQKYKFRGIDDVMNALSRKLVEESVIIVPVAKSKTMSERENKNQTLVTYASIEMEYSIRSLVDNSVVTCSMFGEGMDTSDKATNKAASAAYKYMAIQLFCIPTADVAEADRDHIDETRRAPARQPARSEFDQVRDRYSREPADDFPGDRPPPRSAAPVGREGPKNASQAKKDGDWDYLINGMRLQRTLDDLNAWKAKHEKALENLPRNWQAHVREEYRAVKKAIMERMKAEADLDRDFDPKTGEVRRDDDDGDYARRSGR
jgi:hypothetical protein